MRVVFVLDEFWPYPGGIATYYGMLARLMVDAGHAVVVLLPDAPREDSPRRALAGVEVVSLAEQVRAFEKELLGSWSEAAAQTVRQLAFGLAAARWLRGAGGQRSADVVETMDTKGFGLCVLARDLPPVVAVTHGTMTMDVRQQQLEVTRDRALQSSLELVLLGLADALASPSPINSRQWTACLGREVRFLTPPWAALDEEPNTADFRKPESDGARGLVVGRLERRKGPLVTAEALRICQSRGLAANVDWLGASTATAPGGRDMAAYMAAEFGDVWGGGFVSHGSQSRPAVAAALRQADYVLVPSIWDSFNYTALEAMAAGRAVVVSEGAGATYLLRHGENGLIVPMGDAAALADAIARLHGDADLRARLGREAQATIAREFTRESMVDRRIGVYEEAIQRRRVRDELWCGFRPAELALEQWRAGVEIAEYKAVERMSAAKLVRKTFGKLKRQWIGD